MIVAISNKEGRDAWQGEGRCAPTGRYSITGTEPDGYATLASRTGVTTRTIALITLGGTTTAFFAMVSGPFPLLVGIAVAAGMVRGNPTLLQATAVTDRRGATHYGRLSGLLAAPATIASALAPFAGTALAGPLGGYPGLFIALALTSAAASVFTLGAGTKRPRTPRDVTDDDGKAALSHPLRWRRRPGGATDSAGKVRSRRPRLAEQRVVREVAKLRRSIVGCLRQGLCAGADPAEAAQRAGNSVEVRCPVREVSR